MLSALSLAPTLLDTKRKSVGASDLERVYKLPQAEHACFTASDGRPAQRKAGT